MARPWLRDEGVRWAVRYVRWLVGLASIALATVGLAGETSIGVRITGLPPLPASMGAVRLVDLPHFLASAVRPADTPRWLVVGKDREARPHHTAKEKLLYGNEVSPNWQEGNFVASF